MYQVHISSARVVKKELGGLTEADGRGGRHQAAEGQEGWGLFVMDMVHFAVRFQVVFSHCRNRHKRQQMKKKHDSRRTHDMLMSA